MAASMPLVTEPGDTVTAVAVAREVALCHHWAAYPLAPHPDVKLTRYWPGGSPVSAYRPDWLTAYTGLPARASAPAGVACRQMPVSGAPAGAGPVTVPLIVPSRASVALMPGVLVPAVTVTGVAVDRVACPLYHWGANGMAP